MVKHLIKNFEHEAGGHCESTTMKDLIQFLGIDISEPMAFGLDSTFGFSFLDNSKGVDEEADFNMDIPLFLGGKQGSIIDDSMLCRILGLDIKFETFSSPEVAWQSSKQLIQKNIPVGMQVDLGYLTYFNWEEEIHFSGHFIVLVGYDDNKNLAYVYEREFDDIQEVKIEDLKKARSSKEGYKYFDPHNKQFRIMKRSSGKKPPFVRALKLALRQVTQQFLFPSTNRHGIAALQLFSQTIPNWRSILTGDIITPYSKNRVTKAYYTLGMIYGLIEEMGTGGAIFRNLYSKFLKELSQHPEINEGSFAWSEEEFVYLEKAYENLFQSAHHWGQFANHLKEAIDKGKGQCLEYLNLDFLENNLNSIIPLEQEFFGNLMHIKL